MAAMEGGPHSASYNQVASPNVSGGNFKQLSFEPPTELCDTLWAEGSQKENLWKLILDQPMQKKFSYGNQENVYLKFPWLQNMW